MTRIFTKSFFRLSGNDQVAVVDAAIRDIESCIGRHLNAEDDRKAKRQIARIRQRAVEHGVWPDADRANPTTKGDLPRQLWLWKE